MDGDLILEALKISNPDTATHFAPIRVSGDVAIWSSVGIDILAYAWLHKLRKICCEWGGMIELQSCLPDGWTIDAMFYARHGAQPQHIICSKPTLVETCAEVLIQAHEFQWTRHKCGDCGSPCTTYLGMGARKPGICLDCHRAREDRKQAREAGQ